MPYSRVMVAQSDTAGRQGQVHRWRAALAQACRAKPVVSSTQRSQSCQLDCTGAHADIREASTAFQVPSSLQPTTQMTSHGSLHKHRAVVLTSKAGAGAMLLMPCPPFAERLKRLGLGSLLINAATPAAASPSAGADNLRKAARKPEALSLATLQSYF